MKYTIILIAMICFAQFSFAQTEKQVSTSANFESLISVDRVKLLNRMDVIANMQFALNNDFINGKYQNSRFSMNQFRFEMKGLVHDKIFYRFRNRYTRLPDPQSVDNVSRAVDLAFIRVDATEKWSFSFGKLCADWGGYEFDINPIEIYAYNDIVENADNFLTGIQASWRAHPKHEFTYQLLNSRTKTFRELYDSIPGVQESKFPVALVNNWRGNFADGKFTTLWSYSYFAEAKNKNMHYLALGNKFNFKKGSIIYDFKFSNEDIDRKNIITQLVPNSVNPYTALNVRYVEHWFQFNYRFASRWSASLVVMNSRASWFGNPDPEKDSHLRTSYGLIPSIEFYPFNDLNLRFFGTYIGRMYKHSNYAKNNFEARDFNTARVMFGFISPLMIL